MVQPTKIEKPIQLLVEGQAQQNFFDAFVQHLRLQNVPQIQNFGGVNELRGFLEAFVDSPGFGSVTSMGIVRDAEESAATARQSVEDSLRNAGLLVPGDADASGAPKVHMLILPDGEEEGMLETLLCRSVAEDPAKPCIDGFFECVDTLPGIDIRRPDKARTQAYLATRPMPQVSVGVAAQRGYWPLNHEAFAGVRAFLRAVSAP